MSILKTILASIMYVFKFLSNRNDPQAAKLRKVDAQAKDVQSIAGEVQRKDADAVNRRLKDLLKCGVVLLAVAVLAAGCGHTRVVYVPDGDKAIPLEYNGRPGWWLPDHVMANLLERATENHNDNEKKGTVP